MFDAILPQEVYRAISKNYKHQVDYSATVEQEDRRVLNDRRYHTAFIIDKYSIEDSRNYRHNRRTS
jgi:hypothetical protein